MRPKLLQTKSLLYRSLITAGAVCTVLLAAAAQAQAPPADPPLPAEAAPPRPSRPGAGAVLPPAPSELRGSSVARGPDGWEQAPRHRLLLNNLLVVRLNPAGLEDQVRLGYQLRLSDRRSPLLRDNFLFAGIAPRFNPAFIKIGPSIEIQPLSIFNLRVAAEYVGYFSSFGFLQSFPSPLDGYSDRQLQAGQDSHTNYKTGGLHVMIEPLIQMKLGPIALRDKLAIEYWYMDLHSENKVFYDTTLDTLVPGHGWVITNDLDLLYVSRFGLAAGVRYSLVQPLYADSDYLPGEVIHNNPNRQQRIGPLLAYTFFDRGFTRFNKPTLVLIVNWYVEHRYRTGAADSAVLPSVFMNSPGMPYVVLGFAFQSDLLQRR